MAALAFAVALSAARFFNGTHLTAFACSEGTLVADLAVGLALAGYGMWQAFADPIRPRSRFLSPDSHAAFLSLILLPAVARWLHADVHARAGRGWGGQAGCGRADTSAKAPEAGVAPGHRRWTEDTPRPASPWWSW